MWGRDSKPEPAPGYDVRPAVRARRCRAARQLQKPPPHTNARSLNSSISCVGHTSESHPAKIFLLWPSKSSKLFKSSSAASSRPRRSSLLHKRFQPHHARCLSAPAPTSWSKCASMDAESWHSSHALSPCRRALLRTACCSGPRSSTRAATSTFARRRRQRVHAKPTATAAHTSVWLCQWRAFRWHARHRKALLRARAISSPSRGPVALPQVLMLRLHLVAQRVYCSKPSTTSFLPWSGT